MKYERVNIGEIIERIVRDKNISNAEFARMIGIQRQNIRSTVYSKASIDTNLLATISEMLDVDLFAYYRPLEPNGSNCNKIYDKSDSGIKAVLTIELQKEKKDQVLKLVFGDNNLEILNK